jgi:hypothetical protein
MPAPKPQPLTQDEILAADTVEVSGFKTIKINGKARLTAKGATESLDEDDLFDAAFDLIVSMERENQIRRHFESAATCVWKVNK